MKTISVVLVRDITFVDRNSIAERIRGTAGCLSFRYLSDDAKRATSRIGQIKVEEQYCDQVLLDLRAMATVEAVQVESQRNLIR